MCRSFSEVYVDEALDREIEKEDTAKCIRRLKNNKTGVSDGLVGELLKYSGSGMVYLLEHLFGVVWREEVMPKEWREGFKLFKKGDKEEPGNYRGITLLIVVGEVFCKIRLVERLDKEKALHEDQAGFKKNRSCMNTIYTLNKIVQGRLRENKPICAFVQKAYDTVRQDGLWLKLWDMGVKGRCGMK